MDKKIFDIIPPKRTEAFQEKPAVEEPEAVVEEKVDFPLAEPFSHPLVLKMKKRPSFLILLLLVLAIGTISAFYYLPIVKAEVWLQTNALNIDKEALIGKETTPANFKKILPGKIIVEEQTVSDSFKTTGKAAKEGKAEGTIRIFNEYSTADQPLVATTRFVSSDGKLFRLVARTTVPGQKMQNGKLVPGTVDVLVRSDSAGPDYNIGPSTFSIPGFAGTARYTVFYAKSYQAMKGGFKGEMSTVSDQDLKKADSVLTSKVSQAIDLAFNNRALPGLVLVREKNITVINTVSSAKNGEPAESFDYQIKAKSRAVLLSEQDLRQTAEFYLNESDESGELKLLSDSVKIESSIIEIDEAFGQAKIEMKMSARTYQDLKNSFVREQIKGMTIQEVQKSFEEMAQVSRARIRIFPSFFKKLPVEDRKIDIKISFD